MVQCTKQMVGFVGDGVDDLGVGSGGVEGNEGVVGFVSVVGVDGFGETCKVAVLVKGRGFADKDGGVFGTFRTFSYKPDALRSVFFVEGGNDMTREERIARGLNDSITHVDFMIGTPDLSITGITQDGREVPVFVDGNFAF